MCVFVCVCVCVYAVERLGLQLSLFHPLFLPLLLSASPCHTHSHPCHTHTLVSLTHTFTLSRSIARSLCLSLSFSLALSLSLSRALSLSLSRARALSLSHTHKRKQVAVKVAKEGSLLVFPHTLPEMCGVAQACLNYLPNKRPTFLEIVKVSLPLSLFLPPSLPHSHTLTQILPPCLPVTICFQVQVHGAAGMVCAHVCACVRVCVCACVRVSWSTCVMSVTRNDRMRDSMLALQPRCMPVAGVACQYAGVAWRCMPVAGVAWRYALPSRCCKPC